MENKKIRKTESVEPTDSKKETNSNNQPQITATDKTTSSKSGTTELPYTEEERALASIGYIGFLFILPLQKKNSEFCIWHARQSMALNIFLFFAILTVNAIPSFIPLFGPLMELIKLMLFVGVITAISMASSSAKKGGMWKIPYIYDYVDKLPKF